MKRFLSFLLVSLLSISIFSLTAFAVPDQHDITLVPSQTQVALFPYFSGSAVPQSQTTFSSITYSHGQNSSADWYSENGNTREYLSQYFDADFNVMAVVAGFSSGATYSGTFKFTMTYTPSLLLWSNDSKWTSDGTNITGVNIEFLGCEGVEWRPESTSTTSATGYLVVSDKYFAQNSGIGGGLLLPFKVSVRGYSNQQAATAVGTHPALAKFSFNTFKMTSGSMAGVWGKYDPATQQIVDNQAAIASSQAALSESQHDDLVNGFDDSAGNAANKSLEDGLSSYESEEQKAHDDFNKAMDNYTNPDLSSYKSGFAFISSAAMSWWNALGMFKVILLVGFGLMIFNFISRYRGG